MTTLIVGGIALPALVYGWQRNLTYWQNWVAVVAEPSLGDEAVRLQSQVAKRVLSANNPRNQTLRAVLWRLGVEHHGYSLTIAVGLMMALVMLMLARQTQAQQDLLIAAMWLAWLLVIAPLSHFHYHMLVLRPMTVLAFLALAKTASFLTILARITLVVLSVGKRLHVSAPFLAVYWTVVLDDAGALGGVTVCRHSVRHAPGGSDHNGRCFQLARGIVTAMSWKGMKKVNQTRLRKLLIPVSVAAFVIVTGCATLQTEQDVQDGRVALITGRPDDAVKYFSRAAESNPNYKTPYVLRESVWTYLGRAYYETGKYPEARTTLDKALTSDNDDYVARLYLGMTLVRSNDPDRGRAEMETALNGIYEWLENLSSDSPAGNYWDTNKQIRKSIESGLAEKPAAIELVVTAQRIGKQLEEEIARAQRDNVQSLYNEGGRN